MSKLAEELLNLDDQIVDADQEDLDAIAVLLEKRELLSEQLTEQIGKEAFALVEEPEDEDGTPPPVDVDAIAERFKKTELRKFADGLGVKTKSRMTEPEIIGLLLNAGWKP